MNSWDSNCGCCTFLGCTWQVRGRSRCPGNRGRRLRGCQWRMLAGLIFLCFRAWPRYSLQAWWMGAWSQFLTQFTGFGSSCSAGWGIHCAWFSSISGYPHEWWTGATSFTCSSELLVQPVTQRHCSLLSLTNYIIRQTAISCSLI